MFHATKFEAEPHRTHVTHDNTVTLHNLTFFKINFVFIVSFVLLFFFLYCVLVVFNSFFPNLSSLFSYPLKYKNFCFEKIDKNVSFCMIS